MKNDIEQPWIEAGYKTFSKDGPSALKVNQLAQLVGISRSSFYHLFADLDIFQEKLLIYHSERAKLAAEKVKNCKSMEPDFILVMIDEKEYILFNRQLRMHRHISSYRESFENAIALVGKETMGIWAEMLQLQHKPDIARNYFQMTADILFHRMTEENMNYEWLEEFLKGVRLFVKDAQESNLPKP